MAQGAQLGKLRAQVKPSGPPPAAPAGLDPSQVVCTKGHSAGESGQVRTEGDPRRAGGGGTGAQPSVRVSIIQDGGSTDESSGPGLCSLPLLLLQGQRSRPATPGGQSHRAASLAPLTASPDTCKPPHGLGQVPVWLVALCRFPQTLSPCGLLVRSLQMKLAPQEDLSRTMSLSWAPGFQTPHTARGPSAKRSPPAVAERGCDTGCPPESHCTDPVLFARQRVFKKRRLARCELPSSLTAPISPLHSLWLYRQHNPPISVTSLAQAVHWI